jgi:hypothetical protein
MKNLEFRDGRHEVTDSVAEYLEQFETYQFTYKEAMRKMNDRFLTDRLDKAQRNAVNEHLARFSR